MQTSEVTHPGYLSISRARAITQVSCPPQNPGHFFGNGQWSNDAIGTGVGGCEYGHNHSFDGGYLAVAALFLVVVAIQLLLVMVVMVMMFVLELATVTGAM